VRAVVLARRSRYDRSDSSLYLVAKGGQPSAGKASGDNPAITLLAVVGTTNHR